MAGMTQYLQKKLLDHVNGIASYTAPAAVYLSLHTDWPNEGGSHSFEISVSGTNYARSNLNGVMGAANLGSGVSLNTAAVVLGPATIAWGAIAFLGIEDAATAGNMLITNAPSNTKTIEATQSYRLVTGQLAMTFS